MGLKKALELWKANLKHGFILSREDIIKTSFTTHFLVLTVFRYLEKKLAEKYMVTEIIEILRNMNFLRDQTKDIFPYIPNPY